MMTIFGAHRRLFKLLPNHRTSSEFHFDEMVETKLVLEILKKVKAVNCKLVCD